MFLDRMSKARAGDVLSTDFIRGGVRREQRITIREMPREKGEGYDVVYTPVGQPATFTWIAGDLTQHGYVMLRVERPGCDDSEGGPLS